MSVDASRLDASRQHLRQQLMQAPEGEAEPGQALAADWLSVATGLGGPALGDSLRHWAGAELALRLAPSVRRHPWLAVAAAAAAGALLVRIRWPRTLLLAVGTQVLLPKIVAALAGDQRPRQVASSRHSFADDPVGEAAAARAAAHAAGVSPP